MKEVIYINVLLHIITYIAKRHARAFGYTLSFISDNKHDKEPMYRYKVLVITKHYIQSVVL